MGDEIRNTIGIVAEGNDPSKRIPGEFELLNALHPGITRIYMGKQINFLTKLDEFKQIALLNEKESFVDSTSEIGDTVIKNLKTKIENCFEKIIGKNYKKYFPIENNKIIEIYNKFQDLRQTKVIIENLDLFQKIKEFKKENDSVKIGNSVFEAKYKVILNELENLLKEIDIKKGCYIIS